MMKKYSLIAALVIALTFAFAGCSGTLDDGNGGGGGGGNLVDKVIFDMQNPAATDVVSHKIQELTAGPVDFPAEGSSDPSPIAPIVRAGGMGFDIIEAGGKKGFKYVGTSADWGQGFDLPNSVFGFREGDKITIIGKAEGAAIDLALNRNQNAAQQIVGERITAAGDFTIEATLVAADIPVIQGNQQKVIRFEDRKGNTTVTITQIKIEGKRPSNVEKLAAPVIALSGSTISWPAVPGAGGYKILALEEGGTTPVTVATLLPAVLNYNLAASDLDPADYEVTVIAVGVAGSTSDSDASNKVQFTKAAPQAKVVVFSAGMLNAVAAQGSVVVYGGGTGYTWTANAAGDWGNGYASFQFDLGEALSNFSKVTFEYIAVGGDYNSKGVKFFAGAAAATGYQSGDGIGETASTGNVTIGTPKEISIILKASETASISGTNLWFTIDVPMGVSDGDSSYTINNVEFIK